MRRNLFFKSLLFLFALTTIKAQSQCQNINVNLTGVPDTVWTSPSISRNGQCCGAGTNTDCLSFTVTLDPNTVGVWFYLTGAPALGSEFYQVNCGVVHSMRDTICLTGIGPHVITFCKPGNNPNTYIIEAIAKPTVPSSEVTRIGCSKKIQTYGMMPGSISWTSISPGNQGDYNSYLSCLNCTAPMVKPSSSAPDSVDYLVCGDPIATMCGFNLRVCDTVRVYFKDSLTGSVPGSPFSFCNYGLNPGVTLTANANGGDGNYSYYWFDSDSNLVNSTSSYFASTEDDYILEIRDGLISATCPSYFTGASVSAGELPVVNAGINKKVCATNPTTQLNGSIQNASGIWSSTGSGSFSPSNTILNPFYTPSSTEINQGYAKLILSSSGSGNCPIQKDTLIIYYSDTLRIAISSAPLNCFNDSTLISSVITYGTAPYFYQWNTTETTSSITDGSGSYLLTVTDSVGCKQTQSFSLSAPSLLNLITSSTDVTTPFGNDGTASVSALGGTPGYFYSWSPGGQTTSSISGLTNGIYQVSVTDSKGCNVVSSVVVDDPRCSGFSVISSNFSLNCFGNTNGTLSATATGGTSPYTYQWYPAGGTASTATSLSAGSYMVIVQDAAGCFAQTTGIVSEPSVLATTMSHTDATAVGANNGTAQVLASGGTPAYTYAWNHGPTSSFINGLSPAMYYVTVSDFKGCLKKDSVLIVDPPCNNLIVGVNATNVSCFGGNTGSATAYVAQGTAPYTYSWSNGQSGISISSLQFGNYSLIVTDANNCSELISFTITQPSKLSTSVSATGVSCNGNVDGSVELNVSGGTFPYYYSWSNGSTAQDLFAVAPGTYSVTVSDLNGCSSNATATVSNPTVLAATYSVNPVVCFGASTGSIDVSVSGGTPIYTYSWSNGASTQDLSGISAGYYVLNITDGNHCTLSRPLTIELTQNDSIKIDSVLVSCTNPTSGLAAVSVFASGGVPPYQYSYQNGNNFGTNSTFNLLPGIYPIKVKDNSSCVVASSKNTKVDPFVSVSSSSYLKCFDSPTDSSFITVLPTGGDGGNYQVSFNGGLTYLAYGVYGDSVSIGGTHQIVVRDSTGCLSNATTIQIPSAFQSSLFDISDYNSFGVRCKGSSDGFIQTQIQGGTTPYSFTWSNGSHSQNLNAIPAGNYSLTITDANLCVETFSVTLSEPDRLYVAAEVISDFHGSAISCFGASDGVLQANGFGGAPAYSFNWSNGQNTAVATSISAATYTVTVKDLNNCSEDTTITVVGPTAIGATAFVTSNYHGYGISCFGYSDGSANVIPSGGTAGYSYIWSTGSTLSSVQSLIAGTYSVTVKDSNNCAITKTVLLTQPQKLNSQLQVVSDFNGEDISCNGFSDGMATATVTGGVQPYIYNWSNGDTDSLIINLSSTYYYLNVTDANSCPLIDSVFLSQPDSFLIQASSLIQYHGYDISCYGFDDGSLGVTSTGGTGLPVYLWSNGFTASVISGVPAGNYFVTGTDKNGCTTTDSVTLIQPTPVILQAAVSSNFNGSQISCYGNADGVATANVSGGVSPYVLNWSNGQNGNSATGLTAGSYTVTVNDANSCMVNSSVTLVNPPQLISNAFVLSNYGGYGVSCFGNSNGIVSVNAIGGTGSYTYNWSSLSTSQTVSGLPAGTYSVTVLDTNLCASNAVITIGQPSQIQLGLSIDSDFNGSPISCFGASDGVISAQPSGGVGSFSYVWSNGNLTAVNSNLIAGWYFVMVSDSNSCTHIDSIYLAEPDPLFVSINVLSDYSGYGVSCFGSSNGSVMAIVAGGVGTISYLWSNGSVNYVVSGLSSGNYSVAVTDQNGCHDNSSVFISQPAPLVNQIDSLSDYHGYSISCNGVSDGSIFVSTQGGVVPYSYLWSNLSSSEDLTGLLAGTYFLTTTDANGCTDTIQVLLSQPESILLQANVTDVLCNSQTNGAIDLMVMGGVSPFTYTWSNGANTQDLTALPANGYAVVVTDANACKDTLSVKVSENKPIWLKSVVSDLKCNGDSTGFIDLTIQGGFAPYTVIWNTSDTTQDISSLIPGSYSVIVTDYLGCKDSLAFNLSQPDSLLLSGVVSQYNSGANVSTPGGNDGYIELNVSGGTLPYDYTWSNGETAEDLNGLTADSYTVTVTDENGCKNVLSFILREPFSLEMPTGITPNNDGKNDFFVVRGLEVYPDNFITVFNRWGNVVFEQSFYQNDWNGTNEAGEQLPDGTYYVVLNIENGRIVLTNYLDLRRH